jgi:uncharacterized membrane protein YccF (DUF307 family)
MIAAYLFSLAVFVAYLAVILRRFGVPKSISESYYLWPRGRGQWLFNGFCLLTAVPLMIFWLDISPDQWRFLVFFACAPLGFVGAAGAFKDVVLTRPVHFGAAGVSAVASQVWIVLNGWWWIASLVLLAAAGVLTLAGKLNPKLRGRDATGTTRSAWLFWVEVAAFSSVYIAVMAHYIAT